MEIIRSIRLSTKRANAEVVRASIIAIITCCIAALLTACPTPRTSNTTDATLDNSNILPSPLPIESPATNRGAEVDLAINGVHVAMEAEKVISILGKPKRDKKQGFDECAVGYHRDLVYDGLTIDVLSDARRRRYTITQMELTSSKWKIAPDLHIGDPFSRVRETFGEPIYPKEDNGCLRSKRRLADGEARSKPTIVKL